MTTKPDDQHYEPHDYRPWRWIALGLGLFWTGVGALVVSCCT